MTASRQSANGQAPPADRTTSEPPPDWAVHYQPTSAPLLACSRHGCGAKYLDDDGGRHAHQAVFGHQPRQSEPEPTEGHQP